MSSPTPPGTEAARGRLAALVRTDRLALIVLALLALALRLYRLGAQSLWFDEAQTLYVARFPWAEIIQRAYRPPLYHYMLNVWSALTPNTEFWLRLPSALLGAAVPPLLYLLAAQLYDRRVAWIAALLAVISPTLIAYAQELRMYSLMAVEFVLLLYLLTLVWQGRGEPRLRLWAAILAVTVASLYTHYLAIPFLLCAAALMALTLAVRRRWVTLRSWVAVQAAAAVAFVPWLMVIMGGRGGTQDYIAAEVLPVLPEVPGVREFVRRTWLFYTTGPVTSELPIVRLLALGAALLFALALAVLVVGLVAEVVARRRSRQPWLTSSRIGDLWLLALVFAPWAGAVVMYHLRPGVVHPRHVMMMAAPLLLLAARTLAPLLDLVGRAQPRRWTKAPAALPGVAAILALGALFLVSYDQSLRDPALQRANVRAMAQEVVARSDADTIVLLPHRDFAFEHYFGDQATIYHIETRVGDADLLPWLLPRIQGARRAVLIEWVHLHQDPRDLISWFLQSNGRMVERFWSADRWVSVYDLRAPLIEPAWRSLDARADPLRLTGIALPDLSPTDQTVAIGLEWRLDNVTPRDLKASVRLVDDTGHVIAADDRVLLAEEAPAGTSRWPAELTARNYYLLDLPAGTPPLSYEVQVALYDAEGALPFLAPDGGALGALLRVGEVSLAPPTALPERFPAETPMTRTEHELAPGLKLEGYALDRASLRAGEILAVTLYWRALVSGLPDYAPEVTVTSQAGRGLGAQSGPPAQGRYPTSLWRSGELVIDRRLVRIASEAEAGMAQVTIAVDGERLALTTIQVEETDRLFSLPPVQHPMDVSLGGTARLAGFSLESETVRAGAPFSLTLYWEAIAPDPVDTGYTVFVHLIGPEERIIAQHDGAPAGGEWPVTAWASGQVIVDTHKLTFHDVTYRGQARLAVGLYDPVTLQRLATPLGEDRILLPISISVE